MTKYRKKPVVIDAFKFCVDEMPLWFMNGIYENKYYMKDGVTYIRNQMGEHRANVSDYIIMKPDGEFTVCEAKYFEMDFEKVETLDEVLKECLPENKPNKIEL